MIVQLAPGFRTVVGPQLPPVIENCPGPKFLLSVCAPVIVSDAVGETLVTVTVPL